MEGVGAFDKSLQDELDLKLLDQLAGTVSQISSFCFETKKFCITTEFVVMTLLVKFTENKLDRSIFVSGIAIPFCFWFLDSVAYFYQVRLRGKMAAVQDGMVLRNGGVAAKYDESAVIEKSRINKSRFKLIKSAAINHSMWTYVLLAGIDALTWILFGVGVIQ
ncbi:hypothetical protein [Burkholderia gladioli]|uniref:hypothetical protein n=1 Tax=Burkholderia gladioli TaxID=28095 RepID=UPI0016411A76|nr:hypothetical protein [Burkholderia gladioli]